MTSMVCPPDLDLENQLAVLPNSCPGGRALPRLAEVITGKLRAGGHSPSFLLLVVMECDTGLLRSHTLLQFNVYVLHSFLRE